MSANLNFYTNLEPPKISGRMEYMDPCGDGTGSQIGCSTNATAYIQV